MSHPFGDLIKQYLSRKHGLSQNKLADGILQDPAIISRMCRGERLFGPQARERVVSIIGWFYTQRVLTTTGEANAFLETAGMSQLNINHPEEAQLLGRLIDEPGSRLKPMAVSTTPWALIINLKPEVKVTRRGSDRLETAEFGAQLYPGDIVSTYNQASATVLCRNNLLFQLPENSNFTVDCTVKDHPWQIGDLSSTVSAPLIGWPDPLKLPRRPATVRFSRTVQNRTPLLISPRNTCLADPRPTFHWQPVREANGYRLSLNLASGEVWHQETTQTRLAYPSDAPPLAPGSVNIVLLTTLDAPEVADKTWLSLPDEVDLTTLAEAKTAIQTLALDETAQRYLLAQLYQQREMWAAAIDDLEQLLEEQNSPSANLSQQLGDLYFEIELYPLAEEYYRQALTIAETNADQSNQAIAWVGLARTAHIFAETAQAVGYLSTAERLYRTVQETELAEMIAIEQTKLEPHLD